MQQNQELRDQNRVLRNRSRDVLGLLATDAEVGTNVFPARFVVLDNEELAGKWEERGSKRSDALKFEADVQEVVEDANTRGICFMSTAVERTWRHNDRIWRRTQTVQADGIQNQGRLMLLALVSMTV